MDHDPVEGRDETGPLVSEEVLLQLLRMADLATSKHTAEFLRQVYAKERLHRLRIVGS